PEMAFNRVDLPAPLVPMMPSMSPFSREKVTCLSAQNFFTSYLPRRRRVTYSLIPMSLKSPVIYRVETLFTSKILMIVPLHPFLYHRCSLAGCRWDDAWLPDRSWPGTDR